MMDTDSDEGTYVYEEFEARLVENMSMSSHQDAIKHVHKQGKMQGCNFEAKPKANMYRKDVSKNHQDGKAESEAQNIVLFEQINVMQQHMMQLKSELARTKADNTRLKLVSHWNANFSRLFLEFCRGLSQDIRASVARVS